VGLTFHVGADVEESNQAAFKWNCTAEGLETVAASEIKVITEARADLALTLPANSSIEGGAQSLLFRLKVTHSPSSASSSSSSSLTRSS
jgi:hypothetical protein